MFTMILWRLSLQFFLENQLKGLSERSVFSPDSKDGDIPRSKRRSISGRTTGQPIEFLDVGRIQ